MRMMRQIGQWWCSGDVLPQGRGIQAVIPVARRAVMASVVALLCWQGSAAMAQSNLPTLGDVGQLTVSAERRLGERIVRQLYRDPDYVDDPLLVEYLQRIWQPLLQAARMRGDLSPEMDEHFAWELLLGRDRTVNAFALPGGYFGVHLGLIAVVSSSDELASVLAHELSHVTQRHISRLIAQEGKQTPLLIGAMILAAVAASKNPQAAEALAVGGQALAVQNQLNFSRDMEREADRVGYGLMEPAGFAPVGAVRIFEKLQQANRLNDNGAWPYLRSHPLTTERIADMQLRVKEAAKPGAVRQDNAMEHAMMVARAQVLSYAEVDQWRLWSAKTQGATFERLSLEQKAAALYGAALAASRLQDYAGARKLLDRLDGLVRTQAVGRRLAVLARAEVALAAGSAPESWQSLSGHAGDIAAPARPELLLKAQVLMRLNRAGEIAGQLQTWVVDHPKDANAWQTLASVWHATGHVLRGIRAEAEAQAAQYDYAAAVDRLKAGQLMARKQGASVDFIEASIIDTRLRAVELLLREQVAER